MVQVGGERLRIRAERRDRICVISLRSISGLILVVDQTATE
jgi:hypothetical protein